VNHESFAYDDYDYPGGPIYHSHPRHLQAVGYLSGWRPPTLATARILELGCGTGENLIPIACEFPSAQVVGCDLSKRAIRFGRDLCDRVGLPNLDLRHESLTAINSDWGQFDYIICHGVLSWVPKAVQAEIFRVLSQSLSKHGLAYLSYNTLPGWHLKRIARDAVRFHSTAGGKPHDSVAQSREMLELMVEANEGLDSIFGRLARDQFSLLCNCDDGYLFHEYLAEHNDAFYFRDLVSQVASFGLRYLGEARRDEMSVALLPSRVQTLLQQVDRCEQEQYLDFLKSRMFRRSVFCRSERSVVAEPDATRVASMSVTLPATGIDTAPSAGAQQREPAASSDPVQFAIDRLSAVRPESIRIDSLAEQLGLPVDEAVVSVLHAYRCGWLDLLVEPHQLVAGVSERPRASSCARVQALETGVVTSQRHESQTLDAAERRIVPRLTGTTSIDEICRQLRDESRESDSRDSATTTTRSGRAESAVRNCLKALARKGLLLD